VANDRESRASILVVDDETGMREGCRRVLTAAGYNVDAASELHAARILMQSGNYDLYLLDVMLPDGSGLDFLAEITQHDPHAICIIITGFGSIEMAVEAVRQGAYDFLSKPFTSDELLISVNQGLEHRRLMAIEVQAKELAQARDELERLDEAKSQIMLQMAHELRAPVAAVQSYINLILAGYMSNDEIEPTLTRVQERLQEVLDLIADLLELAHLKQAKGRPSGKAEPQDMAAVLEKVCDLFRQQANDKGQSFQVEIVDKPFVTADRGHLERIWTNLISNAIKYTPEGGQIAVTLKDAGDQVVGTVADSGIGISEDDQAHLFEDFFRTAEAKASGEIGTGLGLSIVKQIVESYGGELGVTSSLGHGSRFTFALLKEPLPQEPDTQPIRPATAPLPSFPPLAAHIPSSILGDESLPESRS